MEIHFEAGLYWRLWGVLSKRTASMVLRTAWVAANNLYAIPAYFVYLVLLLPLRTLDSALYDRIESRFFSWMLAMVACWSHTAGYAIAESGDDLEELLRRDETFLFMPNHQSTADVPFCMSIFSSKNFCDRVMWIMDKVFKFTNFGAVSWMHDDFFILAGKDHRGTSLIHLRSHLQQIFRSKLRRCLVLFPEGGFLRKRKLKSNEFARKNKLPELEFCSLPRTGALEVALEVLAPNEVVNGLKSKRSQDEQRLTKVVDVTIAYPGGKPVDIFNIISGSRPPCTTHVHYRIFDVSQIPRQSEELKQWMYKLYLEKEQLLSNFYSTGSFESHTDNQAKPQEPRRLQFSCSHFVMINAFFVLSTLMFWLIVGGLYRTLFASAL